MGICHSPKNHQYLTGVVWKAYRRPPTCKLPTCHGLLLRVYRLKGLGFGFIGFENLREVEWSEYSSFVASPVWMKLMGGLFEMLALWSAVLPVPTDSHVLASVCDALHPHDLT